MVEENWFTRSLNKPSLLRFILGLPDPSSKFRKRIAEDIRNQHLRKIVLNKTKYPSSDIVFLGHTPEQLAGALKDFVHSWKIFGKNYGINRTQRTGISEYKKLRKGTSPDHPDAKLLKKYCLSFNKIFFLGALRNLAVVQIHGANPTSEGDCYSHDNSGKVDVPPNSASLIKLFEHKGAYYSNDALLKGYLGTLLHEMLHSFLSIYSCRCSQECNDRYKCHVRGTNWYSTVWHRRNG
jgi:hypothetical protein